MESENRPAVRLVGQARGFLGYAFGLQQPALMFAARVQPVELARLLALDAVWSRVLGSSSTLLAASDEAAVLGRVLHWSQKLLENTGHPAFAAPQILPRSSDSPDLVSVVYPCLDPESALESVRFTIATVNRLLMDSASNPEATEQQLPAEVVQLKQKLSRAGLRGFNPTHFLQAAHELGIPWLRLVGNVIQFGQGAHARWLDSSFTDATPNISCLLARNKQSAATVLRAAGIPVPTHFLATSAEDAVHCAEKLGYPVVVKPADRDGGKAVAAHLVTPAAVRNAFGAAHSASLNVLVEKHVPGRDYRVQVVQGEIQGVLERIPGGVTGNGQDCVRVLLERQNEERRTAVDDRRYLHVMSFDEEAELLLAAQAMGWDSVPDVGRVIRLRGAANVTNGGVPVAVPLNRVHPDNLMLALRAAQALRLDVAGVDMLMADIERSWLDSGAFICEVNAQPQMFSTMHKPMLQSLVKGNGRVPVIVFLDDARYSEAAADVQNGLAALGVRAGLANPEGVWIGGKRVGRQGLGAYAGGRILLLDQTVEAIIIHVADHGVLHQGWPIDRCDVVVLGPVSVAMVARASDTFSRLTAFARVLSPRHVIVDARGSASTELARSHFGKHPGLQFVPGLGAISHVQDERVAQAVLQHLKNRGQTTVS